MVLLWPFGGHDKISIGLLILTFGKIPDIMNLSGQIHYISVRGTDKFATATGGT